MGKRIDISGGMDLRSSPDQTKAWPYLQNVRRYFSDRTVSRPPIGSNLLLNSGSTPTALSSGVTSVTRMNDPYLTTGPTSGYVLLCSAGASMYVNATQVKTGFSGKPLSYLIYRPASSPQPWCYVGDSNQMCKVRSDGTVWNTGIAEPQTAPVVATTGAGPRWFIYRYTYYSQVTGAESNPSPECAPVTMLQSSVGGSYTMDANWAQHLTIINHNQWDTSVSGQVRTAGGVNPGTVMDYLVITDFDLNIPDGTQVADVTYTGGSGMTPGTYPLSFSGGTPTTPASGTITVTASTVTNVTITDGGKGYSTIPSVTAATGGTPPTLTAVMTTPVTVDGVQVGITWNGQNTGTGIWSGAALYYQGAQLGIVNSPEIVNGASNSTNTSGGNDTTWGGTLTPAVINDSTFGFGVQITAEQQGGTDRSFIYSWTITVYYTDINGTVTAVSSTDPQVDTVNFYRMDSGLENFTFVKSAPNATPTITDTLNDIEISGNQILQYDNFEPFPSIDLPRKGICDIGANGVLTWVSGDTFNVRWLPGNLINLAGTVYTTYARPTSTTSVQVWTTTVDSSTGYITIGYPSQATGVSWQINEPALAAEPSPVLWGPTPDNQGSFAFGLDPLNPGDLLWVKGNNFDSAPDTNRLYVTSPSEPLKNGTVTSELSTVFSSERFWLIYPNFSSVTASVTGTVGTPWTLVQAASTRGLYMRYAIGALGSMIAWRAKDGVFLSSGGGPEQDISANIYPLFPHGANNHPSTVSIAGYTVYPPDDTNEKAQTITCVPGYIFYDYQDTTGTQRTLVFDMEAKGWSVDIYSPLANCHAASSGTNQILLGCKDGTVRAFDTSASESGTSVVVTSSTDNGNPRTLKRVGGFFLRAVAGTAVSLAFWAQRFITSINGFSPSTAGTGSTESDYLIDFTSATNSDCFDFGAVMSWPLGTGNILSEYDVDMTEEPNAIIGYKTGKLSYGLKCWGFVPWINLAYKSTSSVYVTLSMDTGQVVTLTFPSTGGAQAKTIMWLPPNKFKIAEWKINSAYPVTIFAKDSEIYLVPWDGEARTENPFGAFGEPTSTV